VTVDATYAGVEPGRRGGRREVRAMAFDVEFVDVNEELLNHPAA
jgi:hypothetical protein